MSWAWGLWYFVCMFVCLLSKIIFCKKTKLNMSTTFLPFCCCCCYIRMGIRYCTYVYVRTCTCVYIRLIFQNGPVLVVLQCFFVIKFLFPCNREVEHYIYIYTYMYLQGFVCSHHHILYFYCFSLDVV